MGVGGMRALRSQNQATDLVHGATRPDQPAVSGVSVDPERLSGQPVFRDASVPLRLLFEHLERKHSVDQFIDDFEGVSREQIAAVVRLAGQSVDDGIRAA